MATFNFPFHTFEFVPAENSSVIELKGGFTFASEPTEPYLKEFTLDFAAMQYVLDGNGDIDDTTDSDRNIMALYAFYLVHGMWKTFVYPSPVFGDTNVKFSKPFVIPKTTGNTGVVKNISITLKEQP